MLLWFEIITAECPKAFKEVVEGADTKASTKAGTLGLKDEQSRLGGHGTHGEQLPDLL